MGRCTGDVTVSEDTQEQQGEEKKKCQYPEGDVTQLHIVKLKKGAFHCANEARRVLEMAESRMSEYERHAALAKIAEMELHEKLVSAEERVEELIPEGWFKKYLEFCKSSESPKVFHLLNALALFSHHIGRKAWFHLPGMKVYAPISVFLGSPAGMGRRGQSVSQLARIAKKAGSKIKNDTITPERLMLAVSEMPHMLFIAEEASMLFSSKDYMQGMSPLVCRLLDGDDELGVSKETKSWEGNIRGVCMNVLLTSSPGMLGDMSRSAVQGGVMSRLICGWSPGKGRSIPIPSDVMNPKREEMLASELAMELKQLTKKTGQKWGALRYEGSVKKYYVEWYNYTDMMARERVSDKMSHWYARKAAHLHRLNISLLKSTGDSGMVVTQEVLDRSIALLDFVEVGSANLYAHASLTAHEKKRQVIVDSLARCSGKRCDASRFLARVHHHFANQAELREHMEMLQDIGYVKIVRTKQVGFKRGKGRTEYVLKA